MNSCMKVVEFHFIRYKQLYYMETTKATWVGLWGTRNVEDSYKYMRGVMGAYNTEVIAWYIPSRHRGDYYEKIAGGGQFFTQTNPQTHEKRIV